MKKTSLILCLCVCCLSVFICLTNTPIFALDGNKKLIKGSGKVTSEERSVPAFSKIYASSGINVFIEQGNSDNLKIKADDNLLQYIQTEVSDSTLRIRIQEGISIRNSRQMDIYVKMEQIESLKATSGADIIGSAPLIVQDISLTATSAGDIKIELDARQIHASATSGADLTLKGKAETLQGKLTSGADLKAPDLKVKTCDISLSSGADAYIYVEESISYSVTSGADLKCKGNPQVTKARVTSGGDVKFE